IMAGIQRKTNGIMFVPDLFGIQTMGVEVEHFFGEEAPVLHLKNNLANPWKLFIKKCFDFTVGGLILLLSIPIMGLIAIAIRLNSEGPIIFSSKRIGTSGNLFNCYKFRTMVKDAEEALMTRLEDDPEAKKMWEENFKLKDDPRITSVGRFLRKTSLDELPQIFNVLFGQMSLVGPRPMLEEELDRYEDGINDYFSVKPGITGLWQVSGRSDLNYERRKKLNSGYIRNWSLWLDIVILFKTFRAALNREGAY
ncbi:MAG: exopolysaccharide biosynthesis polyprenyl glycosylphosphotransferase, partial [Candidatus Brocadiales bacterium]